MRERREITRACSVAGRRTRVPKHHDPVVLTKHKPVVPAEAQGRAFGRNQDRLHGEPATPREPKPNVIPRAVPHS